MRGFSILAFAGALIASTGIAMADAPQCADRGKLARIQKAIEAEFPQGLVKVTIILKSADNPRRRVKRCLGDKVYSPFIGDIELGDVTGQSSINNRGDVKFYDKASLDKLDANGDVLTENGAPQTIPQKCVVYNTGGQQKKWCWPTISPTD